jgi:ribosomal protein RSM22 (predicted rRNA methylase)
VEPRTLVRALEPRWQDVLDAVLARSGLSTRDVGRLAPAVAELSRAYNAGLAEGKRTKLPIDARSAFSFPRDVPKGAAAVRELVVSGALAIPSDRPLRVIDLGAGLGAMTWGLVRALAAHGATGRVEALLVDEDKDVLARAEEIGRAARTVLGPGPIELEITTRVLSLASIAPLVRPRAIAPADVVLLGQVLSEIDPANVDTRIEDHASLVRTILGTLVAADGALVIVEPALRDRTRHLHAIRDRLLASGPLPDADGASVSVFAPCLHAKSCPALAHETEWCHEDLAVDLPPWVVPLARAAGLRWQGLTFSYLVLRKDGRVLLPRSSSNREDASPRYRFRIISDPIVTKGKSELFVCEDSGNRSRIRRLDRDEGKEKGAAFGDLRRGDVVTLSAAAEEPIVDERGRVNPDVHVAIDVGTLRQ